MEQWSKNNIIILGGIMEKCHFVGRNNGISRFFQRNNEFLFTGIMK